MPTLAVTRMAGRAMGVTCSVTVVGGNGVDILRASLDEAARLESLWSRFRSTSDISRLNASRGGAVWVAGETVSLLRHMQEAHAATDGLFDPTRLPAQLASGDRSSMVDDGTDTTDIPAVASHDIRDIEFEDDFVVRLPEGMLLDAGGIGKGLAADMIASRAMQQGAEGVCINIGGDMRALGETPDPRGWTVMISAPDDYSRNIAGVCVREGAVATSSVHARRLAADATHIIDPGTDEPTDSGFAGATVIAGSGAWAEAFTKYVLLGDPAVTMPAMDSLGMGVLAVTRSGDTVHNSAWEKFAL